MKRASQISQQTNDSLDANTGSGTSQVVGLHGLPRLCVEGWSTCLTASLQRRFEQRGQCA